MDGGLVDSGENGPVPGDTAAMLRVSVSIALIAASTAIPAAAQHLPFRAYGAGDGLAGDHVRFVVQDSHGFLWLATNAGVSRFDGHDFRNYGTADGLPFPSSRKIVEGLDGTIYVLGREKLARRRVAPMPGRAEFEPVPTTPIGDLFDVVMAPDGSLVLAGALGAARLRDGRLEPIALGMPHLAEKPDAGCAWAAAFDAGGALWIARTYGITRIGPDGKPRTLSLCAERQINAGWGWFPSMTVDRSGRVWLLTVERGLWRLGESGDGGPRIDETLDRSAGLPATLVRAMHETQGGTLWIGTSDAGLVRVDTDASGRRHFVPIGTAEGLPDVEVFALSSDAQENLWAGTAVSGLVRLTADGLTSWEAPDGAPPASIFAIEDDSRDGRVVLLGGLQLGVLQGGRIVRRGAALGFERAPGWGVEQLTARGADGRLWLSTGLGVAMYPPGTAVRDVATHPARRVLTEQDGLPGKEIHRVFAARDGAIWIGVMHAASGVCRMRGDGTGVHCFGPADGLPSPAYGEAFAEDGAGNLWVGLYEGGIYRFRGGRFESWPETTPDRQNAVRSIHRDDQDRLWVAGSPGVLRIDAAESPLPSFRRFTTEVGLASVETSAIAEDLFGRIYVGGVHGVDRMEPDGTKFRRFTTAEGLPANRVSVLDRDSRGDIWVGTSRGIARLVPREDVRHPLPSVVLTGVTASGTPRDPTAPLRLESDERTVSFSFTAPSFRAGEEMRFQWRLPGASDDWTPPAAPREVTAAALSPGRYRFAVRAIDGDGSAGPPASFDFTIRPPVWRRPWFLSLAAIVVGAAVTGLYRAHVARLVELERVRTRIATDLHDDIGASLSQIAVLSQYATRQASRGAVEARHSLARITELSGGLVDAMSDVVWSINPARDRMSDLVHRMRRFALDVFSEGDVALKLELPEDSAHDRLDPETRRQIFLVFKEALRNAARHSAAREVYVSLRRGGDGLLLVVQDDGVGLEGRAASGGAGLDSMRRRAEHLGGTLEIRSRQGGGTEILLRTAVTRRGLLARWTGRPGPTAS